MLEKISQSIWGILGENRNNFIWELEHLGRFWETDSQGLSKTQRPSSIWVLPPASAHRFLLLFSQTPTLLSSQILNRRPKGSVDRIPEGPWTWLGNNYIFIYIDFLLKCIMLFFYEFRQQATIVLAVSVTLTITKNHGHFPITLGWLQMPQKDCFPSPLLWNSGSLIGFVT